ncbi:MAG TPA: hypothetical protein PLW65_24915 [Pseudomonadota bacterium]|nr:hypothetical protein [Pseudomonadota bacterium]
MSAKSSKKPPAPSPKAVTVPPSDTLAHNRHLAAPAAALIPKVPEGFIPTPPDESKRRLRRLSDSLRAEALAALGELTQNRDRIDADLGDLAPDPAVAAQLLPRLQTVRETIGATEALLTFLHELEDIAHSDAVELLESAHQELSHRLRKLPQLATVYPQLLAFIQQRNDAVAEGIARARREPQPTPAAP